MAFSALFLENLTELKTRRGNATDTTIATLLGLNYPPDEGLVFYRWFNLATDTPDDDEIVQPTIGGITTGRWFKIDYALSKAIIVAALGYTPYDEANPDNFISNFTESDPTVPAYSKTLSAFSVIKTSTDPLYRPINYVPSWSEITSKPTTLSGYGISDGVSTARTITINGTTQDLSANRTWTVGDIVSSGSYVNPSWLTSLAYSKITGIPSLSINNAPARSLVTGTGATGFQISTTRNTIVSYSVTINTTVSLSGNNTGYVVLEICPTNSATAGDWIEISRTSSGQSGTLVIGLVLNQIGGGPITGLVPAGYYAKLRSVNTAGTPTYSPNGQQEVQL